MNTTRPTPLWQYIAQTLDARRNCLASGNDFAEIHAARLDEISRNMLPSGSGFDSGSRINLASPAGRVEIETAFHHMDSNGYYTVWTQHTLTLTPAFGFPDIRISGRDRNGIKEYIADVFHTALSVRVAFELVDGKPAAPARLIIVPGES